MCSSLEDLTACTSTEANRSRPELMRDLLNLHSQTDLGKLGAQITATIVGGSVALCGIMSPHVGRYTVLKDDEEIPCNVLESADEAVDLIDRVNYKIDVLVKTAPTYAWDHMPPRVQLATGLMYILLNDMEMHNADDKAS
jgi:hypothetical protein